MIKKELITIFLLVTLFAVLSSIRSFTVEAEDQLVEKDNTQQTGQSQKNFNPKPASASLYNLGLKSYDQGDIQSAISYFKRAIDLDPQFIDAFYNLGAIYKLQKKYPDAIVVFEKASKINSKDYEVIFELASCYFEEKDFENARRYFSLVSNTFPKYSEARRKLELIDHYLAYENKSAYENQDVAMSREFQAQLLADKLSAIESQGGETRQVPASISVKPNPIINNLQEISKEPFENNYRIVTDSLKGPTGIVKDSKNNIYVANFLKDSIEKINAGGLKEIFVQKLGIDGPIGLAIDEGDNLFVANYKDGSIIQITPDKQLSYLVQNLEKPYYLFYDSSTKKLFVTTQGNNSLVEIDIENISKQPITSR